MFKFSLLMPLERRTAQLAIAGALVVFALVYVLQTQVSLLSPTLVYDDGRSYFKYAYEHAAFNALWAPHDGYLNLYANIFSLLAIKIFPVGLAPYVMGVGGLLIYALVLACIISPASPFTTPLLKAAALLMTLFSASSIEALAANDSQFYFAGLAALILVSTTRSHAQKMRYYSLLALCGLSGPFVLFLLPVYAAAYRAERTRERYVQCAILLACGAVQFIAFLYTQYDPELNVRFNSVGDLFQPGAVLAWLSNTVIVQPFATRWMFDNAGHGMGHIIENGGWLSAVIELSCLIAMVVAIGVIWGMQPQAVSRITQRLAGCFLLLALGGALIALTNSGGWQRIFLLYHERRYSIALSMVLGWLLLLHAAYAPVRWSRIFYSVLVAWIFLRGIATAFWLNEYHTPYARYPEWTGELAASLKNPYYDMKISPYGIKMRLDEAYTESDE